MDMGFSCRKNAFFRGAHKIGAAISGPRIAENNGFWASNRSWIDTMYSEGLKFGKIPTPVKIKLALPPPPFPRQPRPPPLKKEEFYGHFWVFQQKEPKKMPGAHKISAHPFPAPELRAEILWTSRFF